MKNKIYDEDFLRQINQNVNLLEYIGESIELKKRGKDYFGHCPLHVDKTPSFSVNPDKNLYYCFSCGKSGGIIQYLTQYEGMKFNDAVVKASKLANIDLGKMCQSDTISFLKKIRRCSLKATVKYKHEILNERELLTYKKEPAKEWIEEGIEPYVLALFDVRIDKRQNRIVYPVYDTDGNLINIKGRTRYPNYKALGIPKYMNYHIVEVMDYFQGMNITLPYIRESGEVIVFESIKSVMKAFGWNFKNCVSAENHNLSDEQIHLLIELKANIVFAYDSDVNYYSEGVAKTISRLRRVTNVYIIDDKRNLLGGSNAKNAPVDCGREVWETLYNSKKKLV